MNMEGPKLLGPDDEPQQSGAVVAVHYGDYRRQEIWVLSGTNIGNWYPLGGEFGRPEVDYDRRTAMEKLIDPSPFRPAPGKVPQHPDWYDVLARGPVTLLVPGDKETYKAGWRNGRKTMWQSMENTIDDDPPPSFFDRRAAADPSVDHSSHSTGWVGRCGECPSDGDEATVAELRTP